MFYFTKRKTLKDFLKKKKFSSPFIKKILIDQANMKYKIRKRYKPKIILFRLNDDLTLEAFLIFRDDRFIEIEHNISILKYKRRENEEKKEKNCNIRDNGKGKEKNIYIK